MRAVFTALPVVTHLAGPKPWRVLHRAEECATELKLAARFMGLIMNRILTGGVATAFAILGSVSCSDSTGPNGLNSDDLSADENRILAAIQVHLAADTIKVGQTTLATVTEQDRRGRPLYRAVTWRSSDASVATVDTAGLVRSVKAGNVSITATHNSISGSAPLVVLASTDTATDSAPPPPPPPPPSGNTNEPAGLTLVSNRPFNALNEMGWADEGNGGKVIQDPTAPKSPNNILRTTLPAGFQGGGGTEWGEINFNAKKVYVSMWTRESANWEGHEGSLTNKRFYIYTTTDVPSIFLSMEGSGSGPLRPYIEGQNIVTGGAGYGDPQNPDWGPNLVPTAQAVRGQWHNIELVLSMNTVGKADGYFDLWLDGVHISHYTGIMFQSSSPSWRLLHYTNLWGGGGGIVANTMWLDWDNLYISAK